MHKETLEKYKAIYGEACINLEIAQGRHAEAKKALVDAINRANKDRKEHDKCLSTKEKTDEKKVIHSS